MITDNLAKMMGLLLRRKLAAAMVAACALLIMASPAALALGSQQNPQNGSVGLEGTVAAPPPDSAPGISTPGNGQSFAHVPITVAGFCKTGLLVKIFVNNIFTGAAQCTNGSYSLSSDLFSGRNDIIARQYDALDQASPDSAIVSVTFNDAQFIQFGTRVSLSSQYAEKGAAPGDELDWPIIISGGIGPYALSIDWGDGTTPDLQSVSFPGDLTLKHVYKTAGIYRVIIQATDKNGTTAFLQLVGVGTGKVTQSAGTSKSSTPTTAATTTKLSPWAFVPIIFMFPIIFLTFWLGRRHELFVLRKKLEKTRSEVQY